tara:strand:- start:3446 stop:3826 length:381 start_codon:yes stop_codon:yes gene_type:complete
MENNIQYFLIYYLSGILSYRILTSMFRAVEYGRFYSKIESAVLKIYQALDADMLRMMRMKYIALRQSGLEDEEIEKIAKKDQRVLKTWRNSAIKKLMLERPKSIMGAEYYQSWNAAMNKIKKEEKK